MADHCLLGPDHVELRRGRAAERVGESTPFLEGHPHAEWRLRELREALDKRHDLAAGFVVKAIDP